MLQQQETLLSNCCFSVWNRFNSSSVWVFVSHLEPFSIHLLSFCWVCVRFLGCVPAFLLLSVHSFSFLFQKHGFEVLLKCLGGLAPAVSISELNLSFNTQKMNRIAFSRYDCPFTAADSRSERSVNKDAAANICWEWLAVMWERSLLGIWNLWEDVSFNYPIIREH